MSTDPTSIEWMPDARRNLDTAVKEYELLLTKLAIEFAVQGNDGKRLVSIPDVYFAQKATVQKATMRPPSRKTTYLDVAMYLCAFVGVMTILGGLAPKSHYELSIGRHADEVETSFWGLRSKSHRIRLQNFEDWDSGLPYRAPPGFDEFDWFIEGDNGEWYPIVEEWYLGEEDAPLF